MKDLNKNEAKTPRLIVRADAGSGTGVGHVMRCASLAGAWHARGGEVLFFSRLNNPNLRETVQRAGAGHIQVDNPHPHPDDMRQVSEFISRTMVPDTDWMVLDGYHFDTAYQAALKELGCRLMIIDDMAHMDLYHSDMLLNPNPGAKNLRYRYQETPRCLLGTRYFLLRREFLTGKKEERRHPKKARRMLITLGGADPVNCTATVIRAIKRINSPDLKVIIVAGPLNPHLPAIETELSTARFQYQLLMSARNMPALMNQADLAVCAGGGTCLELSFMGVPSAIVVLAENQRPNAEAMAEAGAGLNLGLFETLTEDHLASRLNELIESRELRRRLGQAGAGLVDGLGPERVVEQMMPTRFHLRSARAEDCGQIFRWANDPVVRLNSFNTEPISCASHQQWFHASLQNPDCIFYMVTSAGGKDIGQVRFDRNSGTGDISISLGRKARSLGLGRKIIKEACKKVLMESGMITIRALVKPDNASSLAAFKKAGFTHINTVERSGTPAAVMAFGDTANDETN